MLKHIKLHNKKRSTIQTKDHQNVKTQLTNPVNMIKIVQLQMFIEVIKRNVSQIKIVKLI